MEKARSSYHRRMVDECDKNGNGNKYWHIIKQIDPVGKPAISSLIDGQTSTRIPDVDLQRACKRLFCGGWAKLAQKFNGKVNGDKIFVPKQSEHVFEMGQ